MDITRHKRFELVPLSIYSLLNGTEQWPRVKDDLQGSRAHSLGSS